MEAKGNSARVRTRTRTLRRTSAFSQLETGNDCGPNVGLTRVADYVSQPWNLKYLFHLTLNRNYSRTSLSRQPIPKIIHIGEIADSRNLVGSKATGQNGLRLRIIVFVHGLQIVDFHVRSRSIFWLSLIFRVGLRFQCRFSSVFLA